MDKFDPTKYSPQENESKKLDANLDILYECTDRLWFLLKSPMIRELLEEQRELKPSSQHPVISLLGTLLKEAGPWYLCRFKSGKDPCLNELSGIDYMKSIEKSYLKELQNTQKTTTLQTPSELSIGGYVVDIKLPEEVLELCRRVSKAIEE